MDWRTTTSSAAQTDLDTLLSDSIQVALQGLTHQNFAPFMLVIAASGDRAIRSLAASLPRTDVEAAIAALQASSDAGDLRARATVLNVTVREPFFGEAIDVRLEHRQGPAIEVLVPYHSTPAGITVSANALSAATDTRRLWPGAG